VHIRSANPKAQSLLLIHGWPDSFYRFHKLIPLLQAHFNLIIPSIPGFGFSGRIPMAPTEIADIFAILLTEVLGYTQVFVHGGDIAVPIIEALNQHHTALLRGIHLTDVGYPTGYESDLSEKEQQFSQQTTQWMMRDGAYLLLQGTKPQTLAYALHDSPVALAAWIISMIQSQAEGTNVEQAFGGRDALLTNITLYWLTATGGSSVHYYQRMLHAAFTNPQPNVKTNVPTGIALAPRELQFPQEWAERSYAVRQFDRLAQGGHFTALEAPELIAQSLLNFAAQL
jgi:pimeloyl-ACP methyl ester carboxylesterase